MDHQYSSESVGASAKAPCPPVVPTAQVMAIMRSCGPDLGLGPQVLRTLEVLLSCLAPARNHHVVFASNQTLVTRSGGLSERSIRRHISQLIELDLAERADSANGKRYTRHDPLAGMTMRFGLDLSRLYARLAGLRIVAEEIEKKRQRLAYLRCKLRAACQRILRDAPDNAEALVLQKASRRKLSIEQIEEMIGQVPLVQEYSDPSAMTNELAVTGGQNDRHQSSLSKELIDKGTAPDLDALLEHCTEAQSFAENRITSADAMLSHAEKLAPMIGISRHMWVKALEQRDRFDVGALIWLMVQKLNAIQKPAAYFQAVAFGKRANAFSPWKWLRLQQGTIVRGQREGFGALSADNS